MEREKDSKVMCKGPVVRGNIAPSWDGEKASVPSISGAQRMECDMGPGHTGLCRPDSAWGLFPKSMIKSDLLPGKIF